MLTVLALAAAIAGGPHYFKSPNSSQLGIVMGAAPNERLIALISYKGCKAGVKFYPGRYGDKEAVMKFMTDHKVCALVEKTARDLGHPEDIER
jgi:hypothetical protein